MTRISTTTAITLTATAATAATAVIGCAMKTKLSVLIAHVSAVAFAVLVGVQLLALFIQGCRKLCGSVSRGPAPASQPTPSLTTPPPALTSTNEVEAGGGGGGGGGGAGRGVGAGAMPGSGAAASSCAPVITRPMGWDTLQRTTAANAAAGGATASSSTAATPPAVVNFADARPLQLGESPSASLVPATESVPLSNEAHGNKVIDAVEGNIPEWFKTPTEPLTRSGGLVFTVLEAQPQPAAAPAASAGNAASASASSSAAAGSDVSSKPPRAASKSPRRFPPKPNLQFSKNPNSAAALFAASTAAAASSAAAAAPAARYANETLHRDALVKLTAGAGMRGEREEAPSSSEVSPSKPRVSSGNNRGGRKHKPRKTAAHKAAAAAARAAAPAADATLPL